MKRLLFMAVLCIGISAQAQEGTGVIKTNPFGWFAGQYQFGYEHFLSEKASVQLLPGGIYSVGTVSINDSLAGFFADYTANRTGFIVVPEFRYYLGDVAPDGLYVAPFGRFRSVKTTVDEDAQSTKTRRSFGGGFVLGFQYQLANGITGELFLGPQFKSTETTYTGAYQQYDDFGFDDADDTGIRFGLTIGFGL